jgi:hypothetical protein
VIDFVTDSTGTGTADPIDASLISALMLNPETAKQIVHGILASPAFAETPARFAASLLAMSAPNPMVLAGLLSCSASGQASSASGQASSASATDKLVLFFTSAPPESRKSPQQSTIQRALLFLCASLHS